MRPIPRQSRERTLIQRMTAHPRPWSADFVLQTSNFRLYGVTAGGDASALVSRYRNSWPS